MELPAQKGYQVINVDTVVICEGAQLSGHYGAIKQSLAELLKIDGDSSVSKPKLPKN